MAESGTYDDATLQRRYAMAQALMQHPTPIKHWAEGLGNIGESALGGYQLSKLDDERRAEKAAGRGELFAALGLPAPAGTAPEPSQGGFQKIAALLSGGAGAPTASPVAPPDAPPVSAPQAAPVAMPVAPQAAPPRMASAGPVPEVAPDRAPVEPMGDVIRTNPDGTIAGNISAPTIPTPAGTKIAAALTPPLAGGSTDVSAAAKPPAVATAPGILAGVPDEKKAQIALMLSSRNPQVKAIGNALMTQAMAASDTPKYDFKTAGDSLYRTNAKTGTAEPIRDVGRSVKPMSDEERKQWKVPEGVAAGIDDNGKPVFSQPSAVNTVSPVVTGINDRFDAANKSAQAAPQVISSIHEARRALDSGAITGALADQRLFLTKMGTMFGLPSDAVANTEVARASLGNQVLESAKTLGANPSNADRDYIEKVKGGSIKLDESSMRRLLDMQEKWARDGVKRSNDMAEKLVATDPEKLGRFKPMLMVDEPLGYDDYIKANPGKAASAANAPDPVAIAEAKRRGLIR